MPGKDFEFRHPIDCGVRLGLREFFTNSVGRPDRHADLYAKRARAHALFRSLGRIRHLPPDTVVLPAHASEPSAFDGRPVAAGLGDVDRWLTEWMAPENFVRIVELNEPDEFPAHPADLEAGANRCAVR